MREMTAFFASGPASRSVTSKTRSHFHWDKMLGTEAKSDIRLFQQGFFIRECDQSLSEQ